MTRRRLTLALAPVLAFGLAAPSASAQVFADPDSPAGKEYAIPLEKARRDAGAPGVRGREGRGDPARAGSAAGGEDAKPRAGDAQAGLFGAGITSRRDKGRAHGRGNAGQGDPRIPVARVDARAGAPGDSDIPATVGIALAAVLIAGGLAFLLRRGLRW